MVYLSEFGFKAIFDKSESKSQILDIVPMKGIGDKKWGFVTFYDHVAFDQAQVTFQDRPFSKDQSSLFSILKTLSTASTFYFRGDFFKISRAFPISCLTFYDHDF